MSVALLSYQRRCFWLLARAIALTRQVKLVNRHHVIARTLNPPISRRTPVGNAVTGTFLTIALTSIAVAVTEPVAVAVTGPVAVAVTGPVAVAVQ